MSVRAKTFASVRWTATATAIKTLVQIAQVFVLARLLSPADYGLMALVSVVLGFGALFSDFGVNSAFVQRKHVTTEQRSSLFWFNVVVSGMLTTVVFLMSPLIAWFFGDVRLTALVMLSALIFLITAGGAQAIAAAQKELNFRCIALVEIAASLGGFAVAVTAAVAGWGVYALVTAAIVSSLLTTILSWCTLSRGWRPQVRLRREELRPFLGFGSALVANNLVNQINMSIDLFLAGRWLTATQLGYYSVPRNLMLQVHFVVNPVITRVGFPLIAAVQDNLDTVRSIYLKTLGMTVSFNAPIYLVVAWFALDLVTILLGPQWTSSAEILRILALWGAVRSMVSPIGVLVLGMGRADWSLRWNLGVTVFYLPFLWVGASFGPEGVAVAMLAMAIFALIPCWYLLVRPLCHASLGEFSLTAIRPFVLATVAVVLGDAVASHAESAVGRVTVGGCSAAIAYFALSYRANREWFDSLLELADWRRGR